MAEKTAPKSKRKPAIRRGRKPVAGKDVVKSKTLPDDYDPLANFVPKSELGKRLWAIRLQIEAAGGANLTVEECLAKARQLKGYE